MISKVLSKCKKYGLRGGIAALGKKGQIRDKDYRVWFEKHRPTEEMLKKQRDEKFLYTPVFSIVVPVYNTPEKFLEDMILSVQKQSYGKWELCIANADPSNKNVTALLRRYAEKDVRIKLIDVPENLGIAQNTNAAIRIATGDYVGLLDHDDMLSPNALYEIVKCLNEQGMPEVIYTDEDKITIDGKEHFQPNFKPEFNLDMLRANNYICHFFVVKRALLDRVGGFRKEYNGAQDHDLILRCVEKADGIVRIPKILYHWRMHRDSTAANPESKRYAYFAGIRAIEAHLARCGESGKVEFTSNEGFYRIKYELFQKPFVSVVILNINCRKIYVNVLEKMAQDYGKDSVEFIIVDTGEKIRKCYSENGSISISYFVWKNQGGYADMINWGVEKAKGEYILLLSPFIKKVGENYVEELVSNVVRKEVGVVGGKLYSTRGEIKSAGLILSEDGTIDFVFEGLPKVCRGYMNRHSIQQNLSAVTAESMLFGKKEWENVDGFDKRFEGVRCDVEFCRKVRQNGKLVVFDPYAEAITCRTKCYERWGNMERNRDFSYNPNLGKNYSIKKE